MFKLATQSNSQFDKDMAAYFGNESPATTTAPTSFDADEAAYFGTAGGAPNTGFTLAATSPVEYGLDQQMANVVQGGQQWTPQFTGGAVQLQQAHLTQEELQAFIERWGLGEDAVNMLAGLSPDVQTTVCTTFGPKTDEGQRAQSVQDLGRECDGKFILFARSIQKGGKGKGKDGGQFGKNGKGMGMDMSGKGMDASWSMGGDAGGKAKGGFSCKGMGKNNPDPNAEQATTEDLQDFVTRWELNNDAQALLLKLTPDVQATIIKGFGPKNDEGTRCSSKAELGERPVDGKFIVFARSIINYNNGMKGKGKDGKDGKDGGKDGKDGKGKWSPSLGKGKWEESDSSWESGWDDNWMDPWTLMVMKGMKAKAMKGGGWGYSPW